MASILSDSTNSDEQQEVNEQIKQAYALLQQNRIQQSIVLYKKCIQQHPKTWRAYQNLGVAYIMLRQYQNANHVLKTYIQHVPKDPLGHDSLGVSYSQLNDPLQAIACFVNSINLSPTYYMSYYNLGVVLGRLGLYDFALNVYRHCLRLYPNYVNAMNNIADIHKKTNNIDLAIAMFKQIIELDPTYVLGVKNLANCYFSKEQFLDALNTYMKGLQIQPENRDILFNMALCLDHYGLCSEAASAILKGFQHSDDKGSFQVLSKPFIAGNLQHKQMIKMYKLLRVCQKLRKRPNKEIVERYLKAYTEAVGCFEIYDEQEAFFREVKENAYRTKLNFFGCQVKLGEYIINNDDNLDFIEHRPARFYRQWLSKRDEMMTQIGKWRKYTKRLIKQQKQTPSPKQSQLQTQKQSIYPLFSRPYYPASSLHYKSHSYISRLHSHNLKRLILKRHKFIRQYNKFTKNLNQAFPSHQLLTTLTVPSQSEVSEIQHD